MLNTKLLGSVSSPPAIYPEDVFSTYLYTGNGSTQTINNGIDLAGKGGMVWIKPRNNAFEYHNVFDTVRGAADVVFPNVTDAAANSPTRLTSFNSNGFTVGSNSATNGSGTTEVSWTFREQPKFFDVVTFTSTEIANQRVSHNLGSVPGMIFVKKTSGAGSWFVYHRSEGRSKYLALQSTIASQTMTNFWGTSDPTSTDFGLDSSNVAAAGDSLVAYLFAHNAGGFGAAGTDNVISCGSFTTNGSGNATVNLGYEPQWVMYKSATSSGSNWGINDSMRNGLSDTSIAELKANLANAEQVNAGTYIINATATGFRSEDGNLAPVQTYIYMAIRRPMKPPTSGTQVFSPVSQAGGGTVTTGFPTDLVLAAARTIGTGFQDQDRLRGFARELYPSSTSAEVNNGSVGYNLNLSNTSFLDNQSSSSYTWIYECFRRATGFFDEVCYTGTGSANQRISHNLGVAPELIITKVRGSSGFDWYSYLATLGRSKYLSVNLTAAETSRTDVWGTSNPTSTDFGVDNTWFGYSGQTVVAYLFATLAGVSKVGSYTGNGGTQAIACGFTGGARFVMVKATSTTGDWVIVDTARGLVSGNDPFLELNTTAAEQTGQDILDPDSSGFVVNQTTESINASGVSYIFLAIA